jgi:alpha-L-arabinofuranosidase
MKNFHNRLRSVTTLALATLAAIGLSSTTIVHPAESAKLTVHLDQPGARLNPAMWGIFFEDINFGADGGLYAELVKNGGFEFPEALMGWSKVWPNGAEGMLEIVSESPCNNANPHYLRIHSKGTGPFGVSNEGFRGMGVRANEPYEFSARIRGGADASPVDVQLVTPEGKVLASARLDGASTGWTSRTATLTPTATEPRANLSLLLATKGTVELDLISLFPKHTWKDRPHGLRADMVQMLADLRPGFMRFPGGCIVEGSQLDRRYQWKNTIGPVEERKLLINRWNYEFKHRPAPDYYQSFGLGFFEFFQLCEDIGAQPLPILNCGMACQFNTAQLVPMDQLEPYIQDMLDLVEFANGPASSEWGAKRAAMGHPEPFHLKLLGVGNEQWGPQYIERYARFAKAIKARYPEIQLISSAGPSPADDRFNFLWPKLRELNADIVDEHCYDKPNWFLSNAHRYDNYSRTGPKVFMGEYAAQSDRVVSIQNQNNWECALAEAAYMTGLERNGDVVRMASYAPLFAHADGWQWKPDLIWADNLRVYGTPNYYVQQLFSRNHGDILAPAVLEPATTARETIYASAVRDEAAGELILKLVNAAAAQQTLAIQVEGAKKVGPSGKTILLASPRLDDVDSFEQPKKVAPRELSSEASPKFQQTLPPSSFTVLRIPVTL